MPDNFKHLQDIDVPFIVGMVAQAKAFIIDRAMLMLIGTLMAAAGSSSVLSYIVYQNQNDLTMLRREVAALTLSQNTITSNVNNIRRDVSKFTASWDEHLLGHPIRIGK